MGFSKEEKRKEEKRKEIIASGTCVACRPNVPTIGGLLQRGGGPVGDIDAEVPERDINVIDVAHTIGA